MDQLFYEPQAGLLPDLKGALATAVLETPAGRTDFRARCVSVYTNLFPNLSNHVENARVRIRPMLLEQGANVVAKHDEAVTNLQRRIEERRVHLQRIVFAKPEDSIFSQADVANLTSWIATLEGGKAVLTETNSAGGALRIRFEAGEKSVVARWEKQVSLPLGTYRVSVRVTADQPVFRGPRPPVALRIWGLDEVQSDASRQNPQTMEFQSTFEVSLATAGEFLLQCEARGMEASVSYRFGPVRLARVH